MDAVKKLNKLVDETEQLLDRLADEHGPKIDAVRERLISSLDKTKKALADQRGERSDDSEQDDEEDDEASIGVRDVAGSLNDYVNSHPWLALATGVLVAASLGILATSATKRSYRH